MATPAAPQAFIARPEQPLAPMSLGAPGVGLAKLGEGGRDDPGALLS